MKRSAFFITVITAVLLLAVAVVLAADYEDNSPIFEEAEAVAMGSGIVVEPKDAVGSAIYMVILSDVPVTRYEGNINGLDSTSANNNGEFDINSAESQAYMTHLDSNRATAITEAEAAIGRSLLIKYEYRATLNGYAAEMTPDEAAKIAKQANVAFVEREKMFELQTDAGPQWIGATGIWDGTATDDAGTKGEGVVVGVIDTGIDPWNPSFADLGGDGYNHTNPWGSGTYGGVCDPTNTSPPAGEVAYDSTFPCNDKLIAVYGYTASDVSPRDGDGHGSHTASTAAGNYVEDTTIETPTDTFTATISGVAPHANIIMYDGCIDGGGCPGASLSAARDQILLDDVDAVNYSIGSGSPTADPWTDTEALQWLAIRDAGIFVATSAGNAGPGDATVGSPGDLPWMTTVAAGSHNRAFLQELILTDGVQAPLTLDGQAMTAGMGATPIVFAADYAGGGIDAEDARLCADGVFPAGTFSGEIVVCERGSYGRVAKGQTVKDGGAGGYILAQPAAVGGGPGAVSADPHVLPGIHIDYATYQQLKTYVTNSTGTVSGAFSGASLDIDTAHADVMGSFSSRGPNGGFFSDLIVPNVMAPGRSIWAAYHQGPGGDTDYSWNVIGGTSMSSPHVAGSGALLIAVHPDWTPAQIESALVSTAVTNVLDDDGVSAATPFAMGGGRVDLVAAVQAGLVLDVETTDFEDADPRAGGDPTALNLAQLSNGSCVQACSWTRTFSSTLGTAETYTLTLDLPVGVTGSVTPSSVTVAPYATQMITVEVDVLGAAEEWLFGSLEIEAESASVPDMHLPLAVQPNTGDLPDFISLQTRRDAGSELVTDLTSIEITDLTVEVFGLEKGMEYSVLLEGDSNNDSPYDDLMDEGVFYTTVTVPANAKRLVSEVYESESPDVDLFIGTGTTPSEATQECSSTTGSYLEYCDITDPAAGDWWILVQNWDPSGTPPDKIDFVIAVVGGDESNMMVEGPATVDALDPFDIRVFWDDDMEAGERWYGGFTLGTDAGNPGNIGYVPVDLYRTEDDVAKSASSMFVEAGDVVTYTITVQPNVLGEDLAYYLTDTIPAGLTYVNGSASASDGTVSYSGGSIYWDGTMVSPLNVQPYYDVTTSDNDPSCDTGFGGYVDLEGFGILAQSGISGDTIARQAFTTSNPVNFYGETYSGIWVTDDGFAIFDAPSNYGGSPWNAQSLPDSALPNNVAAIMWDDFEIFYDLAENHGVSLATAGDDTSIIEYDNIQYWGGGADQFDFEMVTTHTPSDAPGVYEIVFAYDNISGTLPTVGTIGLENATGGYADSLLNAGDVSSVVSDGFMVCFDLAAGALEPVEITYAVTVDNTVVDDEVIENMVLSTVSNPGSGEDQTSDIVTVGYTKLYVPLFFKED